MLAFRSIFRWENSVTIVGRGRPGARVGGIDQAGAAFAQAKGRTMRGTDVANHELIRCLLN
jgi:hypothetical protein